MLPIIKVPCILIAMVGLQTAVTPPHPPPTEDEKANSTKFEILLKQRAGPSVVKSFCWGVALAEIAVLVSSSVTSPESNVVFSYLIFPGGAAEHIRPSVPFFIGSFLTAFGGYIRYKCYRTLGHMFTFEMSIRKDHILVTSGPYGVVRHPGYTGILFAISGLLLMHGSKGSWIRESGVMNMTVMKAFTLLTSGLVASITTGLLGRMPKEDDALHRLDGKEWEDWAKRVPYKLVPWVY